MITNTFALHFRLREAFKRNGILVDESNITAITLTFPEGENNKVSFKHRKSNVVLCKQLLLRYLQLDELHEDCIDEDLNLRSQLKSLKNLNPLCRAIIEDDHLRRKGSHMRIAF